MVGWSQGDAEPVEYWLTKAPSDTTLDRSNFVAKMRWHIEHEFRELEQDFGLSHCDDRNWRGFHHETLQSIRCGNGRGDL